MDNRASSVRVPQVLVELAKRVVRAFYGRGAGYPDELSTILIDLLIRSMCIKEDDIVRRCRLHSPATCHLLCTTVVPCYGLARACTLWP